MPAGLFAGDGATGRVKSLTEHSDEHLIERYQALGRNLFLADGRLYYPSYSRALFDAVFDEIVRRNLDRRLAVENWIRPEDPMPKLHDSMLVRYSKKERLLDLKAGKVSFAPAASYKDEENIAQRDDELSRHWHTPNTTLSINAVDYPAANLIHRRTLKNPEQGGTAIHFLSFSMEESPKLQRAFNADAYILVLDFDKFYETILNGIKHKFGNSVGGTEFRGIKYYDDLEEPIFKKPEDLIFSKSLHFQYQHEARFAIYGAPNHRERFELSVEWPQGTLSDIHKFS